MLGVAEGRRHDFFEAHGAPAVEHGQRGMQGARHDRGVELVARVLTQERLESLTGLDALVGLHEAAADERARVGRIGADDLTARDRLAELDHGIVELRLFVELLRIVERCGGGMRDHGTEHRQHAGAHRQHEQERGQGNTERRHAHGRPPCVLGVLHAPRGYVGGGLLLLELELHSDGLARLHAHGSIEKQRHLEAGTFFRVRIEAGWARKLNLERFRT